MSAGKITRPNKLYFERKQIDGKVRFRWVLKSPQGREVAVSHITFSSKVAAIKNLISVFHGNVIDEGRMIVVDPEMREKVSLEAHRMLDPSFSE